MCCCSVQAWQPSGLNLFLDVNADVCAEGVHIAFLDPFEARSTFEISFLCFTCFIKHRGKMRRVESVLNRQVFFFWWVGLQLRPGGGAASDCASEPADFFPAQ